VNFKNGSIGLIMGLIATYALADESFDEQRRNMVKEIADTVQFTSSYIGKSALDARVMATMAKVPRHEFVPEQVKDHAYINRPLPIGEGQTISQPYIVALMTDLADVDKDSMAELVAHVYTIEIVEKLGKQAAEDLERLNYKNVTVKIGDGYNGWPEHAPFDAILVTAAPEQIPEPLIEQLKPGGKLVIPVGRQSMSQSLLVIEKKPDGKIEKHDVLPVGFVPLTRDN